MNVVKARATAAVTAATANKEAVVVKRVRAVTNTAAAAAAVVDAGIAHILLQAQPGRCHFAHRAEAHIIKISKLKVLRAAAGKQKKRIARDHLTKAQQGIPRGGIDLMILNDAHRPGPGYIDAAIAQAGDGGTRRGRVEQAQFNALARKKPQRLGGVKRRVKERAKIFCKFDEHGLKKKLSNG